MSKPEYRESGLRVGRVVVRDPDGSVVEDTYHNPINLYLLPEGSSVSYDRLAESRSSARLSFEVKTSYGRQMVDPLNDYRFQMYFGIEIEGEISWSTMGVFRAISGGIKEGAWRFTADLVAIDGASDFRLNPWTETFAVAGGLTNEEAIRAILDDRAPPSGYEIVVGDINSEVVPDLTYSDKDDPWSSAYKAAQSAGAELYYDRSNLVRVRPVPTVRDSAPAIIIEGGEYSVTEGQLQRKVNTNNVYGGVICKSEAPWLLFPVRAEVWDLDPSSPTYSPAGNRKKAKTITDSTATTVEQCQRIAEAEFLRVAGVQYEIQLTSLKDPTIEEGQVAMVTGGRLSAGLYLIDKINFPYGGAKMTLTIRRRAS